jgi:hypothetical protein
MTPINLDEFPETILCDIDGCVLKHLGNCIDINLSPAIVLDGVREAFSKWSDKGNTIILVTARRESMREVTESQLRSFGLFWDVLIMGATRGRRVLINDIKPGSQDKTAVAINLIRDKGLLNV